jgi:rubredoxin
MAGRAWTVSELQQAQTWRATGMSRAEIAQRLDRTPTAVKHVLVKAGTGYATNEPGRPWSPQDQQQALDLFRQGLSRAQIGERLNRTRPAVTHLFKRLKVTYPCPVCGVKKSPVAFVWGPNRRDDIPPCRGCTPGRGPSKRAPDRLVAKVITPPQRLVCGPDREAFLHGLAAQFRQPTSRNDRGRPHRMAEPDTYVMPSEQDWVDRFHQRPEVMGLILHDVTKEWLWKSGSMPITAGRRPNIRISPKQLLDVLPYPFVLKLLPASWLDCHRWTSGAAVSGGGRVAVTGAKNPRAPGQVQGPVPGAHPHRLDKEEAATHHPMGNR